MTWLLIYIAVLIALVVTPIRSIVLVKRRAYWSARWRAARLSTKGFALVGWVFIAIAACEWLAIVILVLVKLSYQQFFGAPGRDWDLYFIVVGLAIALSAALFLGELSMLSLRLSKPREDVRHGQAAATSAGSTTPAGPRST